MSRRHKRTRGCRSLLANECANHGGLQVFHFYKLYFLSENKRERERDGCVISMACYLNPWRSLCQTWRNPVCCEHWMPWTEHCCWTYGWTFDLERERDIDRPESKMETEREI